MSKLAERRLGAQKIMYGFVKCLITVVRTFFADTPQAASFISSYCTRCLIYRRDELARVANPCGCIGIHHYQWANTHPDLNSSKRLVKLNTLHNLFLLSGCCHPKSICQLDANNDWVDCIFFMYCIPT